MALWHPAGRAWRERVRASGSSPGTRGCGVMQDAVWARQCRGVCLPRPQGISGALECGGSAQQGRPGPALGPGASLPWVRAEGCRQNPPPRGGQNRTWRMRGVGRSDPTREAQVCGRGAGWGAVPPCTARPVPPHGAGRPGPATHPSVGLAPPPALVAAHAAVDLHHVAFPQRELPHVPGRKVVPGHRRADDTGREHCGGRRGRHTAATCCGAVQPGSRAGGRAVLLMRGATTGRSASLGTGRGVSRGQEGECSRGQEQMPALRRSQPLRGLPAPGARVSRGQWVAEPSSL